jgi:hypothetical protein
VNQTSIKDGNCIVTPPSGHVDLRQVQVELCFTAFGIQGGLAKLQCRAPFPLGTGNGHAQKRKVIRVLLFQLGSVPKVLKGIGRVPVSQKFDSVFKFGKSRIFRHSPSSVLSPMGYKAMKLKMPRGCAQFTQSFSANLLV